ncbi:hypothetical protein ACIBG8_46825 [Nonomuraea sp. NPDC050556]|uniref:hypothetical protein n=1 Tax=Nonomuraea sp. NPDC050556 TaxID=3364369 RepID=UPI0037A591C5
MTTPTVPPASPESGSTPARSAVYAAADFVSTAALIAHAAGIPALTFVTDPDQYMPVSAAATGHDTPLPIITLSEAVLCADLDSYAGKVAAGALAHTLVCMHQLPTARERWAGWLSTLAFSAVLVGLLMGSPLTLALGAVGWVGAALSGLAAQRASEIAADLYAVHLLNQAGLDGRACLLTMVNDIACGEPRAYRLFGWTLSGVPTAAARARALSRTRPTA